MFHIFANTLCIFTNSVYPSPPPHPASLFRDTRRFWIRRWETGALIGHANSFPGEILERTEKEVGKLIIAESFRHFVRCLNRKSFTFSFSPFFLPSRVTNEYNFSYRADIHRVSMVEILRSNLHIPTVRETCNQESNQNPTSKKRILRHIYIYIYIVFLFLSFFFLFAFLTIARECWWKLNEEKGKLNGRRRYGKTVGLRGRASNGDTVISSGVSPGYRYHGSSPYLSKLGEG